jgi:uncharacterized protein with FMN-binding domain
MKRVILSVVGTVAGLVALLSYKTHGPVTSTASGLPSAGLPGSTTSTGQAPSTDSSNGASPTPTSSSSSAPASTSYTGTAVHTRYGIVQVKVVVSGSKITNVSFVQLTAFDGRSQQINSGAAPILLQETLSAQTAKIDTVSGATYTSDGYEQSLQSALDQAGIR